ncbi:membrane protein [Clostridia bacterium]|nr:membrane protein [Clostridia bacterium]
MMKLSGNSSDKKIPLVDYVQLVVLGVILYLSKICMEALPNLHLLTPLIAVGVAVFGLRCVIAVETYALLQVFLNGFTPWTLYHLYIWIPLIFILYATRNLPKFSWQIIAMLYGFLYGTLCAPQQALLFHYNLRQTGLWILSGLPFDITHGIGNFVLFTLYYPLVRAVKLVRRSEG